MVYAQDTADQSRARSSEIRLGILVGGRSRRMGGRPKGLLLAQDDETILARMLRLADELGLPAALAGEASPYAHIRPEIPRVRDQPPGMGPLGGVLALLGHAPAARTVVVACDMPFIDASLLRRLIEASPGAAVVAPRDPASGKWQVFAARYDASRVLVPLQEAVARGQRSLQQLVGRLGVQELALSAEQHARLRDWDWPRDVDGPGS